MSIAIQLRELDKRFNTVVVFDHANLSLDSRDKVGVIGRNGAGKSTLCRLITGEDEPDSGAIVLNPRLRLGYLEQNESFKPGERLIEFLERVSARPVWDCARMAARFQLRGDIINAEFASLSGGFRTRAKLAAMLLREPNYLLLDEPTNYLDLQTLVLFERLLAEFSGGCLVVSHDREFLKRSCDKTLDVERGSLTFFPGDVEAYLAYKEEDREQLGRQNRKIDARRKHLQDFVDRNRVRASTASRAQSKMKEIDRLRPVSIEHPMATARIRMPGVEPRTGTALACEDLAIGYPERIVARNIRFEIERRQHVAVVGQNGEGKTTFLRTLAGDITPQSGGFRWGYGLTVGYYAQHVYSALPDGATVADYLISQAAPDVFRQDVLDMAGAFLFQGDDVRKSISVLSGGERARLCLAGLLLARRAVLLLDEPTNHLDFETVEALGRALSSYPGTIFFVSHDRTFVHLVATNVVEVQGGRVTLYPGSYDDYLYRVLKEAEDSSTAPEPAPSSTEKPADREPTERDTRKERRTRRQRLQRESRSLEGELAALARERDEITSFYLQNPTAYAPQMQARLEVIKPLLAAAEERWLKLEAEAEGLAEDSERD